MKGHYLSEVWRSQLLIGILEKDVQGVQQGDCLWE